MGLLTSTAAGSVSIRKSCDPVCVCPGRCDVTRSPAHHFRILTRILYLDLQPRNVLFDELETVHLVDFDTAVPLDQPDVSHLPDRPATAYMAPELTDGRGADEHADLYSLGATIYEMAAGRPPPLLEAARRYWPHAAWARLRLLSGRICLRPCVSSSSVCSQPTANSGQRAQPRSWSGCRVSARLALTSSGFSQPMNRQDLSSRHRFASRLMPTQQIRGLSENSDEL